MQEKKVCSFRYFGISFLLDRLEGMKSKNNILGANGNEEMGKGKRAQNLPEIQIQWIQISGPNRKMSIDETKILNQKQFTNVMGMESAELIRSKQSTGDNIVFRLVNVPVTWANK